MSAKYKYVAYFRIVRCSNFNKDLVEDLIQRSLTIFELEKNSRIEKNIIKHLLPKVRTQTSGKLYIESLKKLDGKDKEIISGWVRSNVFFLYGKDFQIEIYDNNFMFEEKEEFKDSHPP